MNESVGRKRTSSLSLAFLILRSKIEPSFSCEGSIVNFTVKIRQADNATLVDVSGRLTSFEGPAFREAIHRLLREGCTNIVLNLTGLDYLDSSGIGELVGNYLSVVKKGGAMKVVGLAPKVEEVLKITQLYQVFPEFPDEASALESFPQSRRSVRA